MSMSQKSAALQQLPMLDKPCRRQFESIHNDGYLVQSNCKDTFKGNGVRSEVISKEVSFELSWDGKPFLKCCWIVVPRHKREGEIFLNLPEGGVRDKERKVWLTRIK